MLRLADVTFAHAHGPAVFDGLSLDLGAGVTWLVGGEGSGKTTLLKLVAGALNGRGAITVDGAAPDTERRRLVAWCDTGDAAVDRLPVAAVLDRLRAASPAFDDAELARHVAGFDLAPHLGKSMFQLSTGTRRKVGLAGVFAMRAPVTLLDDPAAALDGPSVAHLLRTLADADREPSRACVVAVYAVPAGVASPRVVALPERR